MLTTTITLRGQQYDVSYIDHGYEPDTNAHEIDWGFVESELNEEIAVTDEEDVEVCNQILRNRESI